MIRPLVWLPLTWPSPPGHHPPLAHFDPSNQSSSYQQLAGPATPKLVQEPRWRSICLCTITYTTTSWSKPAIRVTGSRRLPGQVTSGCRSIRTVVLRGVDVHLRERYQFEISLCSNLAVQQCVACLFALVFYGVVHVAADAKHDGQHHCQSF